MHGDPFVQAQFKVVLDSTDRIKVNSSKDFQGFIIWEGGIQGSFQFF